MRSAWGAEDQFPLPSVLEGFGGARPVRRKGSSSVIEAAKVKWMTRCARVSAIHLQRQNQRDD